MNDEATDALESIAARRGMAVLYVTANQTESSVALERLTADAEGVRRVRRANGNQRIDYISGGTISLVSTRSRGARGFSADVLSMSADNYDRPDIRAEVMPCLNTSPIASVIIRNR